MSIREVINYSNNLLKGERKIVKKDKEVSSVKGRFKVEIFDSLTGKKTYEAESENRITAALSNVAYMDTIYNTILYNTSKRNLIEAYNSDNSYAPNRFLVLTDTSIEEDPYDPIVYGNILGYADLWTAYSGSDILKGTINNMETTLINDTKHFVIDFPTHVANGTFNSIYTLGGIGINTFYPRLNSVYYDYTFANNNIQWIFNKVNMCVDENNIYVLKVDSKIIGIFNKSTLEFSKEITVSVDCRAISYDRVGNIWGISTNGKSIYKLSKNTLELLETIELPTGSYYLASNNPIDITVNEGFIYIIQKGYDMSGEGSTFKICRIGKDGTYNKSLVLGGSYEYYITKLKSGSELLVGSSKDNMFILDDDLNIDCTHKSSWSSCILDSGTNACDITFDPEMNTVYSGYYSSSNSSYNALKRGYFVPALSHTLLPEPITKTPTNTMKIQYDITVEKVGVFSMPSH